MSVEKALAYFVSVGWTPAQAAGLAANFQAESKFVVDAVGDGGLAYGIGQWHPDRQANFERAFGKSIKGSTLEEQLAFVQWELTNTEQRAAAALRACTTAADAGACVSKMYERPADREGEAKKRAALAMKIAGEQAPAPIEDKSVPYTERKPMLPLILPAILSALSQALPVVAQIFGPRGEQAEKNVKLLGVTLDTVKTITNSASEQEAAEKIANDKTLAAQVDAELRKQPDIAAYLEHVAPIIQQQDQFERGARADTRGDLNDSVARRTPGFVTSRTAAWMIFIGLILLGIATVIVLAIMYLQVFQNKGTIDAFVASLATLLVGGIIRISEAPFRSVWGVMFTSDAATSAGNVVDSTRQQLGVKQ